MYSIIDGIDGGKIIAFKIDLRNYAATEEKLAEVESVNVTASFTLWKKNDDFKMRRADDFSGNASGGTDGDKSKACGGEWTLEKPWEKVCAPGNIGFPEFNFLVYFKDQTFCIINAKSELSGAAIRKGLTQTDEAFGDNFIILFEKSELPKIKECEKYLYDIKRLSSYNLKNADDRARISNVRKVPATKNLWRGYHPYKKSRPNFDTEETRLKLVNESLRKNKIKSVITLCGDEKPDPALGEKLSRTMKKIQKNHNQLFIDTSYETVYFEAGCKEYVQTVRSIVSFINSHPAPFYIHCRLGSDRTGTMSSLLAGICGATWEEITFDYEKTSKAGFGEFRSKRLLEYSYTKLLGKSPALCDNFQKTLCDYFVKNSILTADEILALQEKLGAKILLSELL